MELLLALQIRAERRQMRSRPDPRVVHDPPPGVRARDDHVRALHSRADVGRAGEPQVREARALLGEEAVDGRLRTAPHAHFGPAEDGVTRGERAFATVPVPAIARTRESGRASHFAETAAEAPVLINVWYEPSQIASGKPVSGMGVDRGSRTRPEGRKRALSSRIETHLQAAASGSSIHEGITSHSPL